MVVASKSALSIQSLEQQRFGQEERNRIRLASLVGMTSLE